MDPTTTLNEIRELCVAADNDDYLDPHHCAKLVEAIDVLDDWLTKGGLLPEPWKKDT